MKSQRKRDAPKAKFYQYDKSKEMKFVALSINRKISMGFL
jgi:hypothetical protein